MRLTASFEFNNGGCYSNPGDQTTELVEECKKIFTDLQFMEKNGHDGTVVVEVQNQRMYFIPNASYMPVSRIMFSKTEGCVNYAVQALFTNVQYRQELWKALPNS